MSIFKVLRTFRRANSLGLVCLFGVAFVLLAGASIGLAYPPKQLKDLPWIEKRLEKSQRSCLRLEESVKNIETRVTADSMDRSAKAALFETLSLEKKILSHERLKLSRLRVMRSEMMQAASGNSLGSKVISQLSNEPILKLSQDGLWLDAQELPKSAEFRAHGVFASAKKGTPRSMRSIGEFYSLGLWGFPKDLSVSCSWFQEAAKRKDPGALLRMKEHCTSNKK